MPRVVALSSASTTTKQTRLTCHVILFFERPNPKFTKLEWLFVLPSRAAVLSAQHGLTHVSVANVVAVCGRRGRTLARMV